MLHDSAKLGELTLHATDGEIGHVDDVYFGDDTWTIRYLVVDTGGWLTGRKVLISPRAVRSLDFDRRELRLELTRERIRGSPDFDSAKPVSRQYETEFFGYYGYPYYWEGPYLWGVGEYPAAIVIDTRNWWPGKHVVVSPHWIEEIDWAARHARVRVSRDRIRTSAEYEPQTVVTHEGRQRLQERIEHALHFGD